MKEESSKIKDLDKYRKERKKTLMIQNIRGIICIFFLVAIAAGLYLIKDKVSENGIWNMTQTIKSGHIIKGGLPLEVNFTSDGSNRFFIYNNSLGITGNDGATLHSEGKESETLPASCNFPSAVVKGDRLLYYDIGGNCLNIYEKTKVVSTNVYEYPILGADINSRGQLAVAAEERGYRGVVTVFDNKMKEIFIWKSADRYVGMPVLSPDGKGMMVSCLWAGEGGMSGRVLFFKFNQQEVLTEQSFNSEMIICSAYKDSNLAVVATDGGLNFYNGKGEAKGRYDFSGRNITKLLLSPKRYTLVGLGRGNSGTTIEMINNLGKKIHEATIDSEVLSIDGNSSRIAVLTREGLNIYNNKLELVQEIKTSSDARKVMMASNREIYLISAAHIKLIDIE